MKARRILTEVAKIYGVPEKDLPRTIERFKKEKEDMEDRLKQG